MEGRGVDTEEGARDGGWEGGKMLFTKKTASLLLQCASRARLSLRKRPRLAAWYSVQQKMCTERSRSSLS